MFIPAVAASGFLTIAAAALAPRVDGRAALLIVLRLALAMRLLLVGEDPFLSTDLYRYIWDGRVQAAGINPYIYVPADPALAALRDAAIYPRINRADYAVTAYPPVAQMIFLAVTRIAETAIAMRLAMVAFEIVIVAVVIDLLRRLELPKTAVVAYAWHPLAIWEIANNGHVEAAMVALIMLGVWLLVRTRRVAGAVAVALAVLVKPYAVFVLPAFWRRVGLARPAGHHRDDRRLLSALSRRRQRRARLPQQRLPLRRRAYDRRRHLASDAGASVHRQGAVVHRALCHRRRRDHDLARLAQHVHARAQPARRRSPASSCCSPPGWC